MTPEQLATAFANGSHDEQADFNDNSDDKVYPSDGEGVSDGVTWASEYNGYGTEDKEAFENALNGYSIKHPCD